MLNFNNTVYNLNVGIGYKRGKVKNLKLTRKQVVEIRHLYESKECSQKDLATKYKVSTQTIYKIVNRFSYWWC